MITIPDTLSYTEYTNYSGLSKIQCVSKRMELSETGFYEPYRALLKLTTQLNGLCTRVWQGTIGSIFGVPTVPYSALQSLHLGQ